MLTLFYECTYDVISHCFFLHLYLWHNVAVQILRDKELFVPGIVASTLKQ